MSDQIEWSAAGSVIAQIEFEVMVSGESLILTAAKAIQGLAVQVAQDRSDVGARVIHGTGQRMWRLNGSESQFSRRNHKSFIDVNLGAGGVIDRHQRDVIVVINFPQFGGDADVVKAVMRHQLIAADLVPFSSGGDFGRPKRVDAQTDSRSPGHCVLDELHSLAVPGKQKWA